MSLIDRFSDMRAGGINTNDATATPYDIMSNKTAYASGQRLVGTYLPTSEGGYDLSHIGSPVTVEPQSNLGVRNGMGRCCKFTIWHRANFDKDTNF